MLGTLTLFVGVGAAIYAGSKRKEEHFDWTDVSKRITSRKKESTLYKVLMSSSRLNKLEKGVATQKPLPSVFGATRLQQIEEMAGESNKSAIHKEIDRDLALSVSSLGLTIAGTLFYSPLYLLSVVGLTIVYIPWFKDGYQSLFRERRVRMSVVDSAFVLMVFATGQFLAGAVMATFVSLGKKLLIKAEDHSQKKLVNVFSEQPRSIWVLKDDVEIEIPFEELKAGDMIMVHAGESVPVDGVIVNGQASIDQHILTGESQPVEKEIGDQVFAVTVVLSGKICVEAQKAGQDTVAAQIGEILNQSMDFKMSLQWKWLELMDKMAIPILATSAFAVPFLGTVGALALMIPLSSAYTMRVI